VRPFVEKGIPTFVDKPFCYTAAEGKAFLKFAKRCGTAVTSFSILPHQKSFYKFQDQLKHAGDIQSATMYGPCDIKSEYGGIFFYGIHQVDAVLHAFGFDVRAALVSRNGANATGQLFYENGCVITMNFIKSGVHEFSISASGTEKIIYQPLQFDKIRYLMGVKVFTKMFKDGIEPLSWEQMLRPVQVLESLKRSIRSGKREKVDHSV
jgi:predicted dehydrogenase